MPLTRGHRSPSLSGASARDIQVRDFRVAANQQVANSSRRLDKPMSVGLTTGDHYENQSPSE